MRWPEMVVPELVTVPARASSLRGDLPRSPDLKYAASHEPPEGLRHAPDTAATTRAISWACASLPTCAPASYSGAATRVGVRMRTPSLFNTCSEAWNCAAGGSARGVSPSV